MKLEFTKIGQEKHDVLNNLFDINFLMCNEIYIFLFLKTKKTKKTNKTKKNKKIKKS